MKKIKLRQIKLSKIKLSQIKLSRRDFLKIALIGGGTLAGGLAAAKIFGFKFPSLAAPTPTPTGTPTSTVTPVPSATQTPTATTKPRLTGLEIESQIAATKIPVVEYHYIGYHAGGVIETEDAFNSEMDFFKQNGFNTITDVDLAKFLAGEATFPVKTFALRIDQGAANFEPFETMLGIIRDHGFSAMVYVISGENYTDEQWGKLVNWCNEGLISIGSHSIVHSDFAKLSPTAAYNEALGSKRAIEQRLADLGVVTELVSFAFPSDSVPDNVDFVRRAGYKFCLGAPRRVEETSATTGNYLVPCIYPYVLQKDLDTLKPGTYNPRAVYLVSGYTFDDVIYMNTTPITLADIEGVIGEDYPEESFAEFKELPVSDEQKKTLVRPAGIIIHTDGNDGNSWNSWTTSSTYNGLLQRKTDSHFAVDRQGAAQFLKMYPDFCTPTRGALGFMDYISIEMGGRDYNDVLDPQANAEKVAVIKDITSNTISLVKTLIEQYGIDPANVLGHYQATAYVRKTDPGQEYMEQYFLPLLQQALA
jgi:hypothetical protein